MPTGNTSPIFRLHQGVAVYDMHTEKSELPDLSTQPHYNNATGWKYRACVTSRHCGLQRTSISHHLTAL